MAELVLGGVGAAVGSLSGQAYLGFQIGVTLGSLLFPPEGPRLERGRVDEIRIQGAQQGSPIPIVYGRNRTAGTIIWATGLIETSSTSTSGGKGGGRGVTTTEYSYATSLAILVCEGTITKIRRIWANEEVIYDWRTGGSPTYASFLDSSKVRVYLGNQTAADAAIEADKGAGNVPAHKGTAYVVFEDLPLAEFGNQIPNFTFEVESAHANLKVALEDLVSRVGLSASDYDFSAVVGYPTRGMLIGARTEAGRILEAFAKANFFEIVESEGKIKSVIRNGNSVLTIPSDDIGAAEYGDTEAARYVETTRAEETELPREFVVAYQSEAIDFLQWTQTARRTVRWSENQEQIAFPMSLADAYARYIADAFLMERWASRSSHKFTLSYKYIKLDPGDVVTIPDEGGGTRVVRIVEMSMGLLAQIEVHAVDDDPIIYVDPGLPASVPTGGGSGVIALASADLLIFETNAPFDSLADDCRLGAVAGRSAAGWKGGEAQIDPTIQGAGTGSFRTIAEFSSSCQFGYTTTDSFGVLGNSPPSGRAAEDFVCDLDATNTVRVTMTNGTLSSCTYDEMVQDGRNLCLVGDEIIQFQTATLVSGSTYTLSNLLRYRRGTDYLLIEYALLNWAGHQQGERFVLFNSKVQSFAYDPGGIGETHNFRIIENGKDYSGGLPSYTEPLTLAGLSRKPYGPCGLWYDGDRSGSETDISLYWTRRVRKKGNLYDYSEAPLDESAENYVIEIWSDDLAGLTNEYEHSGPPPFVYSIADQTNDGYSAKEFRFIVRQKSNEAGVGSGHRSLSKFVSTENDFRYNEP